MPKTLRKPDLLNGWDVKEAMGLLMGEQLGSGIDRNVYECPLNPEHWVLKVDHGHDFANVAEFNMWSVAAPWDCSVFFAPCVEISPCGTLLIQERTTPLTDAQFKELKKMRVPWWFTDFKRSNWGMLNGKFVCHDYSRTLFNRDIACFIDKVKMQRPKWH